MYSLPGVASSIQMEKPYEALDHIKWQEQFTPLLMYQTQRTKLHWHVSPHKTFHKILPVLKNLLTHLGDQSSFMQKSSAYRLSYLL